jgi:tripartite-type tricarboxylate transporter receptor subunit TctC
MVRFLLAIGAFFLSQSALAQNFPTRPITVVVPFAAGGGMEFLVRSVQSRMEAALGQPIIIENRPGATGNIGNTYVAKAEPDGYTLLLTAINIGMLPHVFPHLSYDPIKSFTPIGALAETPLTCVVNPASRYKTLADLISDARTNPGKVKYATPGPGSPSHLVVELLSKLNNVQMTQVPYKGSNPALTDIMGGFVDVFCLGVSNVFAQIKENKLRALAVTTASRSVQLPEVPTVKELGLGDMDEGARYIVLAPSATPKPIVDHLTTILGKAVADKAVQEIFLKSGYELTHATPADVTAMLQQQYDLWGPFVKELNLKLE